MPLLFNLSTNFYLFTLSNAFVMSMRAIMNGSRCDTGMCLSLSYSAFSFAVLARAHTSIMLLSVDRPLVNPRY